jgi:RNA:NAD 2'-phosphotransferase (TPT1/KptA family)
VSPADVVLVGKRLSYVFHRSANGVWLVDAVPPGRLTVLAAR